MSWQKKQSKASVFLFRSLLVSFLLGGCASTPQIEESNRLVWPPAPLQPRIQFVRSIVGEQDLKQDTTFSQEVMDFLTGVKPPPKHIAEPMGIAVSDDGQQLYVSNFRGYVFVFDFANQTFTKIESLAYPSGLALDHEGHIHVVEQGKSQISVFDAKGKKLRTYLHSSLERPTGIAIDRERNVIYIADTGRSKKSAKATGHNVKVFNMSGELVDTIGNERGDQPGQFTFPTYLALDKKGNLYVTDTLNARIQMFAPNREYIRTIGQRGNAWGMFDKPKGVALDSFGNIYVADSGWSNVQIFNPKGDVLLFFGGRGPLPGMLKNPTALAIDATNHIYVADYINHRVNVYKLMNTSAEDSYIQPSQESTTPAKQEDKQ